MRPTSLWSQLDHKWCCRDFLFSVAPVARRDCVCSCAAWLAPLLATSPAVTEPPVGIASSFHRGSFYNQRMYYCRNSITRCDQAACWRPLPIKAAIKPFLQEPCLTLLIAPGAAGRCSLSGRELCHSPCCCKAELIVSLTHQRLPTLTHVCSSCLGKITKLKIDRNPFAKGFRDPGRNRYGNLTKHQHLL